MDNYFARDGGFVKKNAFFAAKTGEKPLRRPAETGAPGEKRPKTPAGRGARDGLAGGGRTRRKRGAAMRRFSLREGFVVTKSQRQEFRVDGGVVRAVPFCEFTGGAGGAGGE